MQPGVDARRDTIFTFGQPGKKGKKKKITLEPVMPKLTWLSHAELDQMDDATIRLASMFRGSAKSLTYSIQSNPALLTQDGRKPASGS